MPTTAKLRVNRRVRHIAQRKSPMNRVVGHTFFVFAALLCSCIAYDRGGTVSFTVVRDIVFTPANWPEQLTADLYIPAGVGPFPGVVMVHGGSWGSRWRSDMNSEARAVAKRGYVVINVSHRFAPDWHFPAQLRDIQQAVLWLRANAGARNVRADRIGVWGFSSGAHLAALVGVTSPEDKQFVDGARVQAVVAGSIPADLRYYTDRPVANDLMGISYKKNPELWRQASPVALVTADDPPVFIYHGTEDSLVDPKNARALYDALRSANVPAELDLIKGAGHYSMFFRGAPAGAIDFLDIHLR